MEFDILSPEFPPTGITLPGGSTRSFTYDPLMRTKTIQAKDPGQNPVQSYSYAYDKMDNITQKNTEAGNFGYGYDELYRLKDVNKDSVNTEAYTYDQVGNRITAKNTTGNWSYNSNNELQSQGGTAYQYDQNGNTTQKTSGGNIQNYIYDVDNRLVEVRDSSNNLISAYTYDPFGRRIKKAIYPSPPAGEGGGEGVTTFYLYADEGLIGEYDGTGTEIKTYGYKPDSTWSTDPIFMKEGGQVYFYHNDHLGTPQKLTNISGAVVWSATYDAFGKATVDASSTVVNNLRFPGQYWDGETGLHYNWHRYYDPNAGRYLTEDPIGFGGGDINVYIYVGGRPLNRVDTSGLIAIPVAVGVCLANPACASAVLAGAAAVVLAMQKLIETIEVPDVPMPIPDLSNTPESCRIAFEICRKGCKIKYGCDDMGRVLCISRCSIELAVCLIGAAL